MNILDIEIDAYSKKTTVRELLNTMQNKYSEDEIRSLFCIIFETILQEDRDEID